MSLHEGFGYRIQLAGELHPPRYPFGYSVSMLPLLWLGVEPVLAPFWVNRVAALALLLQVFFILRAFGGPLAAGLGVLLTATLPAYIILALRQTRVDQIPQLPPGYEWKSFYSNAAGGSLAQAVFRGREPGGAGLQPAIRGMNGMMPVLRRNR